MTQLFPLFQIVAEAIDQDAYRGEIEGSQWELRRRSAMARAKAGIRIAQALGWRFIPPGDFEVLGEDQLDAHCDRAIGNLEDATKILKGQEHG